MRELIEQSSSHSTSSPLRIFLSFNSMLSMERNATESSRDQQLPWSPANQGDATAT